MTAESNAISTQDRSISSMMLQAGVSQIETQNDIFVSNMKLSWEMNLQMLDQAAKARKDQKSAAMSQAIADGVEASVSGLNALTNVASLGAQSRRMNPETHGSSAFKSKHNEMKMEMETLSNRKTALENQQVKKTNTADNSPDTFSDVTDATYQTWKAKRNAINDKLAMNPDLPANERATLRKEADILSENINHFKELKNTRQEMASLSRTMENLVDSEKRLMVDKLRNLTELTNQIITASGRGTSAYFKYDSQTDQINADEHKTLEQWFGNRTQAFQTYANQAMQMISSLVSQISEARQLEQSSVQSITGYKG
ncbi:hypothetical protein AB1K70_03240 [Bremerella sp. JC770]|uniref:hypothetical protein n=1 Tax=Bremerella sp. JC770 TaxID=3232137 RepID=UPI00345A749D